MSQHLQGSAPCVAPHTTQPSDFNSLSWLPITDKIKSKPFPGLTPASLSHHSSSPRQYPTRHILTQTHHTLHKLNYLKRSPLIILHMPFPLPKILFHLPLTKSSFKINWMPSPLGGIVMCFLHGPTIREYLCLPVSASVPRRGETLPVWNGRTEPQQLETKT